MKNFIYSLILNKNFLSKSIAFLVIIIALYLLRDFLILFVITFLVGYLTYQLATYINKGLTKLVDSHINSQKIKLFFYKLFSKNFIITLIYICIIFLLIILISRYIPKIFHEIRDIPNKVPFVKDYMTDYIGQIEEFVRLKKDIQGQLDRFVTEQNINILIKIFNSLKNIGDILIKSILVLVLSYFFVIERKQLEYYFNNTKIVFLANVYKEIKSVFKKIGKRFSIIFKAQAIISFTNTILTLLGLILIGYLNNNFFPYMLTLCSLVFVLGFIPVLGTFLSSIPIIIIGFIFGGINTAVYCIIMILFIHALETYVLNPQIVSSYTHLPVAMTFLILLISEHFLGPIGLLIGIPVFFIAMDILIDIDKWFLKRNEKGEIFKIEEDVIDGTPCENTPPVN